MILRPAALVVVIALGTPALAWAQGDKCDAARDIVQSARAKLKPDSKAAALDDALQNLRRAVDLCRV